MTTLTTLTAGWAVVGKQSGSSEEHSVLAASASPFTEGQLARITEHHSPGNNPVTDTGAAALPWVWQFGVALHGELYLGVAVRDWSGETDAFHRAIACTRYSFVPMAAVIEAGTSLRDLHATVEGDQPPWRDPGARFRHPQRPLPVRRAAPARSKLTLAAAATLAAAVVESPVALLGGRSLPLAERLAALDEVRELLPAGAMSWLSQAGWAYGDNTMQLCFSEKVRKDVVQAQLQDVELLELSPSAARYRDALLRLCRSLGRQRVVEHLRTQSAVQDQDFAGITACLEDVERAQRAADRVRAGSAEPSDVRWHYGKNRFSDLSEQERVNALTGYLRRADSADLFRDQAMLVEQWHPDLAPVITDIASAGLRTKGWSGGQFAPLGDLAERVGQVDAFVAGIRITRSTPDTEVGVVESIVVERAQFSPWHLPMAKLVAEGWKLSVRLARRWAREDPPGQEFFEVLNSLGPGTEWARFSRLYQFDFRENGVTAEDVALLVNADPEAVPELLTVTTGAEHVVVDAVLSYLEWHRSLIERPEWEKALRAVENLDAPRCARLDMLLYLARKAPVYSFAPHPDYVDAMVDMLARADVNLRIDLVGLIYAQLPKDWSSHPKDIEATLTALARISSSPDGQRVVHPQVREGLNRLLRDQPDARANQGMAQWLPFLDLPKQSKLSFRKTQAPPMVMEDPAARPPDPQRPALPPGDQQRTDVLARPGADAQQTGDGDHDLSVLSAVRSNAAPSKVALLIAELANKRKPPHVTEMADALCGGAWRPSDWQWVDLVDGVRVELHRTQYPRGDVDPFCVKLAEAIFAQVHTDYLAAALPRAIMEGRVALALVYAAVVREPEYASRFEDPIRRLTKAADFGGDDEPGWLARLWKRPGGKHSPQQEPRRG